jgi:hypothetical protein
MICELLVKELEQLNAGLNLKQPQTEANQHVQSRLH